MSVQACRNTECGVGTYRELGMFPWSMYVQCHLKPRHFVGNGIVLFDILLLSAFILTSCFEGPTVPRFLFRAKRPGFIRFANVDSTRAVSEPTCECVFNLRP